MISSTMQEALTEQLNREFHSAYLYLGMSAHCSHHDFNGAAQWMMMQYQEEQLHANKIYNYLIDQGVQVALAEIAKPPSDFGSLIEVFKASLDHEQQMTSHLNEISDHALKEKDHASYNLLQWFVNEQVEEEATVSGVIAKLNIVGHDGYGLLMIDNELGARSAVSLDNV